MNIEKSINDLLRSIIDDIMMTNNFAIKGRQPGNPPRPNKPYCSVSFLSSSSESYVQTTFTDMDDAIQSLNEKQKHYTFSIDAYLENAYANLEKIELMLYSEDSSAKFKAGKIGLISISNITDTSNALENGWEESANMNVTINTVFSITETITCISAMALNGTYKTGNKSYQTTTQVEQL